MRILKNKKFLAALVLIALIVLVQLLIIYIKRSPYFECEDPGANCMPGYHKTLSLITFDELLITRTILIGFLIIYLLVNLFIFVKKISNKKIFTTLIIIFVVSIAVISTVFLLS